MAVSTSRRLRESCTLALAAPLGLSAFLSGRGIGDLVGSRFGPGPDDLSHVAERRARARAASFHETTAAAILVRNPFDSRWAPPRDSQEPAPDETALDDPGDAPPCADTRVVAIVASDDPDWSFAALQTAGSPPLLRRRGGEIADKTVVFVGRERVWMRSGGRLCLTSMFSEAPVAEAAADAGVLAGPAPDSLEATLAKGIQRLGPTEFRVDRSVLERVVDNQTELLGHTHIALEKENRRNAGVRLSGIARGALLGVLGIENGDRLQTINGYDVTNPTSALEAFARLQQAPRLDVVLTRRGATVGMQYEIR